MSKTNSRVGRKYPANEPPKLIDQYWEQLDKHEENIKKSMKTAQLPKNTRKHTNTYQHGK